MPKPSITEKDKEPGTPDKPEFLIPYPMNLFEPHYCVIYYWYLYFKKDPTPIFYVKAYREKERQKHQEKQNEPTQKHQ